MSAHKRKYKNGFGYQNALHIHTLANDLYTYLFTYKHHKLRKQKKKLLNHPMK